MNKFEAVKILNLSGEINQAAIKLAYRKACSKYHPDHNPAGLEMMKLVNVAYDVLCKEEDFSFTNNTNYDSKLNDAINAVINMEGINIEICGIWIWLSGNTKQFKEELKKAGYKWAAKKLQWYFRPEDYKSSNRKVLSMDEIREKHGSKIIPTESLRKIA